MGFVDRLLVDRFNDIRRRERGLLVDLGEVGRLTILLSLALFFRLRRGLVESLADRGLLFLLLLVHLLLLLLLLWVLWLLVLLLLLLRWKSPWGSRDRAGNSAGAYRGRKELGPTSDWSADSW